MRIGLLSSYGNPQLPHFIKALVEKAVTDLVVILDSQQMNAKDLNIWERRTGGQLELPLESATSRPPGSDGFIPFYVVPSHNHSMTLELIQSLEIQCLLNAGTPRKLNTKLLNATTHGVLNIHPGALPKYRGCSCVEHALLNGDPVANSAHFMDAGYDTGPVIEIETFDLQGASSYTDIRVSLYRKGYQLAARVLKRLSHQAPLPLTTTPQNEELAQYWKPISDQELEALPHHVEAAIQKAQAKATGL